MKKIAAVLFVMGFVVLSSVLALAFLDGDTSVDVAVVRLFVDPSTPIDHALSYVNFTLMNFGNQTVTTEVSLTILGSGHAEAHRLCCPILEPGKKKEIEWGFYPCNVGNYTATTNVSIRTGGVYDPNSDNNFKSTDFEVIDCSAFGGCGQGPYCSG